MLPPFSASIETGIKDHILEKGVLAAGVFGAFSSYKFRYSNNGWKTSEVIIGARGSFHYPFVDKLDTYTGLMAGYGIITNEFFGTYTEDDYTGSPMVSDGPGLPGRGIIFWKRLQPLQR